MDSEGPRAGAPAFRRRAVFTDRDGTLNPDFHYLDDPERYDFLPGVIHGLRLLREHGFLIVCVTNQSGVGRGRFSAERLVEIHRRINERLKRYDTQIDDFYACPHLPEDGCDCRKPGLALFRRAEAEHNLDLRSCAIVGDRALDVEVGAKLGILSAFVPERGLEEAAEKELQERAVAPDLRAESFLGAALEILALG